jgi:hypothetical protein
MQTVLKAGRVRLLQNFAVADPVAPDCPIGQWPDLV